MPIKINGSQLPTQPSSWQWLPREKLGIDGNGHPIYAGVREFEMQWEMVEPPTVSSLQDYFEAVANTGTAVVELPYFISGSYTFYSYSGCVLNEPELGAHFMENYTSVILLITNIRT